MPTDATTLYYAGMGLAACVGVVEAYNYLRLATQIDAALNQHSAEWRQSKSGGPDHSMTSRWPARRLEFLILTGSYREMLPNDPSVEALLRRARMAGWIVLFAFLVAVVCLGAADAGSRYR